MRGLAVAHQRTGWAGYVFGEARIHRCRIGCFVEWARALSRDGTQPTISRSGPVAASRDGKWLPAERSHAGREDGCQQTGVGVRSRGCGAGTGDAGLNMFSRVYKLAVSLPPLAWVVLFLLTPYLLLLVYSFWSVTPTQQIVHTWSLQNYRELLHVPVYFQVLLRSMRIAAGV